jgi:hypothetical protein
MTTELRTTSWVETGCRCRSSSRIVVNHVPGDTFGCGSTWRVVSPRFGDARGNQDKYEELFSLR